MEDSKTREKILKVHAEEKIFHTEWIASKYYDYPDGEDLLGKLSYTTKFAAVVGMLGGIAYTKVPPRPTDAITRALRISKVLVPSVGMAVMFTTVTYLSTNIRKKDDEINYVFGGGAAGFLLGALTNSVAAGAYGAVICSLVGYAKKALKMNDIVTLKPIKKRNWSSYIQNNWDFTLLEDSRRGDWTKEPQAK